MSAKAHSQKKEQQTPKKSFRARNHEPDFYLWGRHAVEAFLSRLCSSLDKETSSRCVLHIIVDKQGKAPPQLKPCAGFAEELGIRVAVHRSADHPWPLAETPEDLNHQRVCLKVPHYPVQSMEDALVAVRNAGEEGKHGCVGLVLDQVQDPRNFGAILRCAAFFSLKFVIYATDRQASLSPLVLRTSAGGAFSLALIPTTNINRALEQLKENRAWIVGAALAPEAVSLGKLPRDRAWVAVLGNEAKGLRKEVLRNCDCVTRIEGGQGTVDSLNVSVATGVLLHSLVNNC